MHLNKSLSPCDLEYALGEQKFECIYNNCRIADCLLCLAVRLPHASRLFRVFSVGTTGPEKNSRGNTVFDTEGI